MTTPSKPQRPVESTSAAPGEKRSAARPRASESGNPDVHKALGDLYTARQNLAAVRAAKRENEDDYRADEQAALERLRDLGYDE